MNVKGLAASAAAALLLTSCGGSGTHYTPAQQRQAEDFCGSTGRYSLTGMGIDQYTNPEGYDRCVKDAVKVTACLDTPAQSGTPWVPSDCTNGGYQ